MTDRTPTEPPRIVTMPDGAEMILPPTMPEGVEPPPAAINVQVTRTKDEHGGHWITWTFTDGTLAQTIRWPWQTAPALSQALVQGSVQMAQQIQAEVGPQLLRPGTPAFEQVRKLNGHLDPGPN